MKLRFIFLLSVGVIAGLVSCKNNDYVLPKVTYTYLSVINAGPDTLNYYLNGTRQNGLSSIYPKGFTGMVVVPSGSQNYQFKKAGKADVLFSLPLNLSFNSFNTLYLAGESADKAFKTQDTIPVIDTSIHYKSTVRFVNASPDLSSLGVTIGDTLYVKSLAFKGSSIFYLTGSGQKHVKMFVPGLTAARLDTTITFQPRVNYTLFASGSVSGTGNASFKLGIIVNQLPN